MYILCAKECKCDIADWEGYIGTTRVHSLAGMKMRDRCPVCQKCQVYCYGKSGGKFTPRFCMSWVGQRGKHF